MKPDESVNPYAPPEIDESPPHEPPGPGPIALIVIIVVCLLLALFFTPADPPSTLIAFLGLLALGMGTYFAGYFRASRRGRR